MNISMITDVKALIATGYTAFGVFLGIIGHYFLNRRGVFEYSEYHNKIGHSVEDNIYGSVKLTWNDIPVPALYLSTIVLTNTSMRDYESVTIKMVSENTDMLTHTAEIVGTSSLIDFTKDYHKLLEVPENEQPTEAQYGVYHRWREFFVPVMNRGQKLHFELLSAGAQEHPPIMYLDVLHKGVKCKRSAPKDEILGVSQLGAFWVGLAIGTVAVVVIVSYSDSSGWAALSSFVVGVFSSVQGAYVIRGLRKIRNLIAG